MLFPPLFADYHFFLLFVSCGSKSAGWNVFRHATYTEQNSRIIVMLWNVQGNSKFLGDFLHNIGANGSVNDVQYGSDLRWDGYNGIRVANSWDADYGCGCVHGWDLLCFSYFRWTLLLERQALWQWMGPLGLLAHWLVPSLSPHYLLFYIVFLFKKVNDFDLIITVPNYGWRLYNRLNIIERNWN